MLDADMINPRDTHRTRILTARSGGQEMVGAGKALMYSAATHDTMVNGKGVLMTFFHATGRQLPGGKAVYGSICECQKHATGKVGPARDGDHMSTCIQGGRSRVHSAVIKTCETKVRLMPGKGVA